MMFDKIIPVIAVVMIAVDYIYLQAIQPHFQWQIRTIQNSPIQIKMWGAALCYILLVLGLYHFIIRPNKNYLDAFLFGLVIYGVYETTNYALFDKWAFSTVIIDSLWGGILFALTTLIVRYIQSIW
jgi:uncharacterized membrane protein